MRIKVIVQAIIAAAIIWLLVIGFLMALGGLVLLTSGWIVNDGDSIAPMATQTATATTVSTRAEPTATATEVHTGQYSQNNSPTATSTPRPSPTSPVMSKADAGMYTATAEAYPGPVTPTVEAYP